MTVLMVGWVEVAVTGEAAVGAVVLASVTVTAVAFVMSRRPVAEAW